VESGAVTGAGEQAGTREDHHQHMKDTIAVTS
jgi:hypothetical protein